MRFLAWAIVACLAVVAPVAAEPLTIEARALALNVEAPAEDSVGRLRYRGGLALTAPDPRFGGLSALLVSRDGSRLTAVSDKGMRLDARLVHDGHGNLAGIGKARLTPLTDLDGQPLSGRKKHGDAESLAQAAGGFIASFERRHRLWHYRDGAPAPTPVPPPQGLEKAPKNGGVEALTRLADGRLLVLTEDLAGDGGSTGWIGNRGNWQELTYATEGPLRPTGAATLPDGDVVVVERSYSPITGVRIRLVRVDGAGIAPGSRIVGRELATLRPPLSVDNFEGISARLGTGGETLLYLLSDDNFNALQRTLLMMFEVME